MHALKHLDPREDDVIWHRNASTIRRLYQEERKTLKEVKAIMEIEKGFPETPLSTWEIKLRHLKMQKKVKAKDWPLIYQHVRPRLQKEGKKKLIKPTAVLINGTEKPWNDCWREIRRNKAFDQQAWKGRLHPLPPGIVIRTPSPEIFENTLRVQKTGSPDTLLSTLLQTTVVGFKSLLGPESQPTAEPSNALMRADSVYRLCLEGIAFTKVLEEIPGLVRGFLPSPRAIGGLEKVRHGQFTRYLGHSDDRAAAWTRTPWKAQLVDIMARLPALSDSAYLNGRDLDLNFNNHHYLSIVLYLLSNKYHISYLREEQFSNMEAIFEMTFRFVSRRFLLALFQSRLPSIRAAWEQLLPWAGRVMNREAFRVLITVGMDNDWLQENVNGHEHLYHTVQNECGDLVNTLLARGCRPDSPRGPRQGWTAIMEALAHGDLDCARLLIQHCHVNQNLDGNRSNFKLFIMNLDDTNKTHRHCLSLFLDKGAEVDCEMNCPSSHVDSYWYHARSYGLMEDRPLSILDYVFYFHRPLFPRLAAFSKVSQRFSRSRALWCLEQGAHVLRAYLQDIPTAFQLEKGYVERAGNSTDISEHGIGWLELLLAEQFLLGRYTQDRYICCRTVQALMKLGPDLESLSRREGLASDILYATARLMTSGKKQHEGRGRFLMRNLLNYGFKVQSDALKMAVTRQGVAILECLAKYCSDLKQHGAKALAQGVEFSNFKATSFLLDKGVDPNSAARVGRIETNILGVAAMKSSLAMMKYLARRGAKLWNRVHGGHPSDIVADMFMPVYGIHDRFAKVQYIFEEHITVDEPFYPSAYVLDAYLFDISDIQEGRRIFEYLLRKGANLRPGSPLASWIAAGGGHQLVGEMLDAGADVNAYISEVSFGGDVISEGHPRLTPLQAAAQVGDYTLACWLLDRGADLNPPILARDGTTALQEICKWDPVRPEERIRKDKIIKLFLDKGADVNAESPLGFTALLRAARQGDLSTAFLLLKHGANPNVVTFYSPQRAQTALDGAAENGRLDMVDFLLNANALSASASSGGNHYDGAIERAMRGGHFVVAELIRKHSADRQRDWAAAHVQGTTTTVLGNNETQQPEIYSNSPTAHDLQADRQHTTGSVTQIDADLRENGQVCYDLGSGINDSEASLEAIADSMTGVEITGPSRAFSIEEIDDKSPLVDNGREKALGGDEKGITDQNLKGDESSLGTGRGPESHFWNNDEEQNDRKLVTGSLGTDVFMGFSEL